MTKEILYHQNCADMANIILIMTDILNGKLLTNEELARINYCEKVAIQAKQKFEKIKDIK